MIYDVINTADAGMWRACEDMPLCDDSFNYWGILPEKSGLSEC